MNPLCDTFDEQLAAECGAARPWSASLEAHLAGCPACAARARQRVAVLGLLRELERPEAPGDLLGRVVGSLHGGRREERAVGELRTLAGPGAPAELDGRLDDLLDELRGEGRLGAASAPAELAPRVDADLRDLPAAVVARQLRRLPTLGAPPELDQRVAAGLAAPRTSLRPVLLRRAGAGLAAAAAVALLFGLGGRLQGSGQASPAPDPLALDFRVERPGDLDALSAPARDLYEQLSGGLAPVPTGASRVALDTESESLAARRTAASAGAAGAATPVRGAGAAGAAASSPTGGGQALSVGGGPGTSSAGAQSGLLGARTVPTCFEGLPEAPFVTHFRGDRQVTLRYQDASGAPATLEYLEEVASDGAGAHTIVPFQVLAPGMTFAEEADFLQRQAAREGFFFRYRDFRVHDWSSFQLNYEVLDLGQTDAVAGVPCKVFEVRRVDGSGPVRRVSVDPQTSLVLAEEVLSPDGTLLRRTRFQTFQPGADLSDLQLTGAASSWTPTDLAALGQQLQGDLLVPDAPPAGHELEAVSWRPAAGLVTAQADWAQLVYGDGVESVFFLYEDGTTGGGSTPTAYSSGLAGDLVRVYRFADWTLVEGRLRGRRVILVGRVHEQELLLMLQSAIE